MHPRQPAKTSSQVSPGVREALARLAKLRTERPELAQLIHLHESLLPDLFAVERVTKGRIVGGNAIESAGASIPMFRVATPELDNERLVKQFHLICNRLVNHRDPAALSKLSDMVARREFDPAAALNSVFQHGPREFQTRLAEQGIEAQLTMSVLRLSALPLLSQVVETLDWDCQRVGWKHGYCPMCGSGPLLAEFRGLEQFRWLRCGLCASGWQVDRIFCPFCATRDHRQLQDLYAEGQQQAYRVSVCDSCGAFVPGISTLAALTPPGLLVAELETLHLALFARQRGYGMDQLEAIGG